VWHVNSKRPDPIPLFILLHANSAQESLNLNREGRRQGNAKWQPERKPKTETISQLTKSIDIFWAYDFLGNGTQKVTDVGKQHHEQVTDSLE
jgi:hypothetical protein